MNSKENLKNYLLEQFERNKEFLKNSSSPEIFEKRLKSINYFSEVGFPTRKDEEWRFTNITPITQNIYTSYNINNYEDLEKKLIQFKIRKSKSF